MSLLKGILKAMQTLEQQYEQGSSTETFIAGHRNCRTFLVNHALTDLSRELKGVKASGEFDIALSLLEHCKEPPVVAHIFKFDNSKSKDFAFWLQSRLLRIYAASNRATHHEKTLTVHSKILEVILETNQSSFALLVMKLIALLAELCQGCEVGEPFSCVTSEVHYTVTETSDPLQEHSMTRIDLDINNTSQVELLQVSVMKLLKTLSEPMLKCVEVSGIESLVSTLCWTIEFSSSTIKASTCELLSEMMCHSKWLEEFPQLAYHNLMACMEVVTVHSLTSSNESLNSAVTAMLNSMSRLPLHNVVQLSIMLVETITDSSFGELEEGPLLHSLFQLLLTSAKVKSIISMTLNRLLTDWILSKLQTSVVCETMIKSLGDLMKCQPIEKLAGHLDKLKQVMVNMATSVVENSPDVTLMLRHCCHTLANVCLQLSSPTDGRAALPGDLNELATVLLNFWRKCVASGQNQPPSDVCVNVMSSISSLLTLIDVVPWSEEVVRSMLLMSSLPWLHSLSPKDYDMNVAIPADLMAVSVAMTSLPRDQISAHCLCSITMFPASVSPKWRVHLLRSVAAKKKPVLLAAIANNLRWLLLNHGQSCFHLIYDVLHPMLALQSSLVDEVLAEVLGPLVCITAGRAHVQYLNTSAWNPLNQARVVHCHICDGLEVGNHYVDPGMFEPFMHLLNKENDNVRLAAAGSIPRLFLHLKVTHANGETMSMLQTTLNLLSDPCRKVRTAFSSSPHRAFYGSSMEVIGQVVDKILTINGETQDEGVKETLIMTVFSLGKLDDDNLLPICMRYLVESYLSCNDSVSATAFNHLQKLADFRGLTPAQVYHQNQSLLAECLSEKVVEILSRSYAQGSTVMDLFHNASTLFHYEPATFFKSIERHIVPYLVSTSHSEIPKVLKLLAGQVGKSYQQLFTSNMQYVFSHLVRSCDRPTFENRISFLEKESRLSIGSLLRQSFQGVLKHLLLYFGARHQQIKLGLTFLLSQDGQTQLGRHGQVSDDQLSDFLEKQLLGVLVYFDHTLLQKSTDLRNKENVMSSLIQIIKQLGTQRVTRLKVKISTSLKLALASTTAGTFLSLSAQAWLCFVQHVEVTALKPMLSYIVVTLLPLLRSLPVETSKVLKYLVVTCRKELSSSFSELYFVPDIPELSEVNGVLKSYMVFSGRPDAFPVQLKQYLAGIQHENMEVGKQALSKLKLLLMDNKNQLHQMVSGAETVHPLITEAMIKLTCGRVKADDEMKLLYADCLAELGAIDPGKMTSVASPSSADRGRTVKNLGDVNSPSFSIDYIEMLVTALLSAETSRKQDCIALAIQEALSLFDVKPNESNDIWQGLCTQTQDILPPYLESQYTITDPNWLKVESPVYASSKGAVYADWLCNWTALLASKVTDGFAFNLFRRNMAAISASATVAVFILPYVVTYVLAEDIHTDLVKDEILKVVEDAQVDNPSQFCHMALQSIFSVLDEIKVWGDQPKPQVSTVVDCMVDENKSQQKICDFINSFPHDKIARASLNCKSHARSLLHYEQHMEGDDIHEHLDTLQEIYASMDEPDGVSGVDAIRETPATLHQQAVVWENVDKLSDALVCYEEAIDINPTDLSAHEGLMKCYLKLGNWYQAISHSPVLTGVDNSLLNTKLISYKVEAAWKLGNWDLLRDLVSKADDDVQLWGVGVGRLLLAAKDRLVDQFHNTMQQLKKDIVGPLCAAGINSGSLQKAYPYLVQLHMLSDIEAATKMCLFKEKPDAQLQFLLNQLDARFSTVQASVTTTEPLVTLRRSLLLLIQEAVPQVSLTHRLQKCWLERANIARQANQLANAYGSLEKAARYGLAEREVEKAKLFWHRGDTSHAQTCLGRVLNSHYENVAAVDVQHKSRAEQLAHAEVYLLYAWYHEGDSKFERAEVMKHYKKAIEACPRWETGYFRLAVYYDKYLASRPDNHPLYWRVYKQTVQNYALSVRYGCENVYQSMSRAISLWLDFGSDMVNKVVKDKMNAEAKDLIKQQHSTLALIHSECIEPMKEHVAGFQWFTVFSQLVSRLCHAHPDVTKLLQEVISTLIVQYPQQTIWNMMAISKSSFPIRLQRCQSIFERAKAKSPALHKFFKDITKLTDRLLELTNKTAPPRVYTLSLNENFRFLKRLLDDPNFSEIMLPGQSAMTVTLPAHTDMAGIPKDHSAFSTSSVFLAGFKDQVEILRSMIKPKKLTMIGSDGKAYPFLCKPKDDLRKDGRLMELNDIINKLLRKDAQSRRMQLYIKTYAVIPLNEECGLLEWINNTTPYRNILNQLYKEKGCYTSMSVCTTAYAAFHSKSPLEPRLPVFRNLREKFPPILHLWFLRNFPDPTEWYNARVTYARTLAVMSVIGYIVGLGDRHGENILLDSTTGGIMHVDFNCLFNKGLTFDWPEVVPFRLTHNMVAAMGPLGYEGIFRKAAEVTLRVMKQEKDQLMSILRPFIYDPLVEWSKPQTNKRKSKQSDTGEVTNELAMTHVQTIENRLTEGDNSQSKGLWLSTEGHVQDLIAEATDEKNLAKMFVGWAAFF